MKKLLLLLFVSCLFTVNAQSDEYDFKSKNDIEAAIQTTNLNDIYNQAGIHSLGYGYYVATAIDRWDSRLAAGNLIRTWKKKGNKDIISNTSFEFRQNGKNYSITKLVFLHGSGWGPVLNRKEAIEVISENKELLKLELMTQAKYDTELERIKLMLEKGY